MFIKDDLFFKELERCIGEFYVIEEKNQNIVYVSDEIKLPNGELKPDDKCYKVFHARDIPCPFCPKTLDLSKPEFIDGYAFDGYVSTQKKWFQYKMSCYSTLDNIYRIVIKHNADPMMELNREAIDQVSEYSNLYEEDIRIKNQLSYEATHDGMTQLFNKGKYLNDILRIKTTKGAAGIIVCDVNNLKQINDTFGHTQGDQIIRTIADVLKTVENEDTKCYRIGGDEFAVLQENSDELSLKSIVSNINQKIHLHNNIALSLAMGWTICLASEAYEEAFKRADKEMYLNKSKIKNETV